MKKAVDEIKSKRSRMKRKGMFLSLLLVVSICLVMSGCVKVENNAADSEQKTEKKYRSDNPEKFYQFQEPTRIWIDRGVTNSVTIGLATMTVQVSRLVLDTSEY